MPEAFHHGAHQCSPSVAGTPVKLAPYASDVLGGGRVTMRKIAAKPKPVAAGSPRFCPSDKEVIVSYLLRRAQGLPIFAGLVIDFDIYTSEPWKLPSHYFIYGKEGEMFFFTPRHRMSTGRHKNTSRFHVRRTAGEGSWETSGSMKSIWNGEAVIGSKTVLVFKRKDKVTGAVTKTDWIMHEYLLISSSNQFQDLALCKIYYSGKEDTNIWEGAAKIKKRKLKNEPPRTCSDVTDPTIGQVFSLPEISSCMTQWEESDDQFLIPEQLVSREEKVKEQSAAATDEELLTELASHQCTTVNLPSWDKTYCSPDITSALKEDNCFEGLDDILNLRDYDDL